MNKTFIETVKKLYGDEAKIIVTNSKLTIRYSSCPSLVEKLDRKMFSRSSVAPNDNKGLFPITKRKALSLWLNGVCYAAIVTPVSLGRRTYYCIELADTTDYLRLGAAMQTYIADSLVSAEIRRGVAGVHASQLLIRENVYRNDMRIPNALCDKSCNIIVRALANPTELLYYTAEEPERRTVNISNLTYEICAMYAIDLSKFGSRWKIDWEIESDCKAVCKGERFAAALLNLIENGLSYNISEKKHVRVTVEKKDGEVRVAVTDNGVGMSLDKIEKAFIPYALCDLAETYGCLGLPLANIFAKTYGGSANIVSKVDEGTTVTLRLPETEGITNDMFSPTDTYNGEKFSMLNLYMSRIVDDVQ